MMHKSLEPRSAASEWATDRSLQSFGENPPGTIRDDTAEPSGTERNHNSSSLRRKVGQSTVVAAMDPG
jgi:hypothetical protein